MLHKYIWKREDDMKNRGLYHGETQYLETDIESAQSFVLNFVNPTVLVSFIFWFRN